MSIYENYVTLLNVDDGQPGQDSSRFQIEANQNEILKFYDESTNDYNISPEELVFSVYDAVDASSGESNGIVELPSFPVIAGSSNKIQSVKIAVLGDNGAVEFSLPGLEEEVTYYWENVAENRIEQYSETIKRDYYSVRNNQIYFNFQKFIDFWKEFDQYSFFHPEIDVELITDLEKNLTAERDASAILHNKETAFRIRATILEGGVYFLAQRYFSVSYGMNSDMAKLSVEASGIYASIQNNHLSFDANGLTITNGGLKIKKPNYSMVNSLTEEDFNQGEYFIYDSIEGYKKADIYSPTATYYKRNADSDVFFADAQGNLNLIGHIEATSGSFTGSINASEGIIGGFQLSKNALTSTVDKNFKLDGRNGILSIGKAELHDRIIFGDAKYEEKGQLSEEVFNQGEYFIYDEIEGYKKADRYDSSMIYYHKTDLYEVMIMAPNMETNDSSSFLQVHNKDSDFKKTIDFDSRGLIHLTDGSRPLITLNGRDQCIHGANDGVGTWKITPTDAYFQNVTVSGEIDHMVIKEGSVLSVNGIILVRPNSKIVAVEDYTGTFDNLPVDSDKSWYLLTMDSNELGIPTGTSGNCRISYENKNGTTVNTTVKLIAKTDTTFLVEKNENINWIEALVTNVSAGGIGVGINGTNVNGFIPSQAVSVLEFNDLGAAIPKIIMGKLPDKPDEYGAAANSYGLYAENVFLTGQLTAKTIINGTTNYSGIGTTLSGSAPNMANIENADKKFPNTKQKGQILFWAGAEGTDATSIEGANFVVDQFGNMYAGSAYFNGTIISNSEIEASIIKTSKIIGIGEKPALTIEDAKNGICFVKNEESGEKKAIFTLGEQELEATIPFKISNNILIDDNSGNNFSYAIYRNIGEGDTRKAQMGFGLGFNILKFGTKSILKYSEETIDIYGKLKVDDSNVTIKGSTFYTDQKDEKKCEYRQVDGGYDLYIFEGVNGDANNNS